MTTTLDAVMQRIPAALLRSCQDAQTLHVFSDYSDGPSYSSYSFMFTDLSQSRSGLDAFQALRSTTGFGRRMSYKNLGDGVRAAALPGFCEAARQLHGHVMTFAIARSIDTLFAPSADDDSDAELSRIADKYGSPRMREHLARVLHFFAFSLAGLSRPGQHVEWFTDVDPVVPEQEWLHDFVNLAGNLASHYLVHTLGDMRIGTTRSDDGTLLLEDLCAVPDLIAGSVAQALSHQGVDPLTLPTGLVVPLAATVRRKSIHVLRLLRNAVGGLRSTCLSIEPDGIKWRVQVRYFHEMPMP